MSWGKQISTATIHHKRHIKKKKKGYCYREGLIEIMSWYCFLSSLIFGKKKLKENMKQFFSIFNKDI